VYNWDEFRTFFFTIQIIMTSDTFINILVWMIGKRDIIHKYICITIVSINNYHEYTKCYNIKIMCQCFVYNQFYFFFYNSNNYDQWHFYKYFSLNDRKWVNNYSNSSNHIPCPDKVMFNTIYRIFNDVMVTDWSFYGNDHYFSYFQQEHKFNVT
jgi:hypothetical protein